MITEEMKFRLGTTAGLDYILECIKKSPTNYHHAYLTDEIHEQLLGMGFMVKRGDKVLSKISWPQLKK